MYPLNPYPGSSGKEVDLRKELNSWFFGSGTEVPKGQIYVLRRMRRAAGVTWQPVKESDLQRCDCSQGLTLEPDITYPCRVCEGEGYLFDDFPIVGYKEERYEYIDTESRRSYGKATIGMAFFYIEYHEDVSRFDRIIEASRNDDGSLISPMRAELFHNIHMAQPMRSDSGRIEFWRCGTFTEPV